MATGVHKPQAFIPVLGGLKKMKGRYIEFGKPNFNDEWSEISAKTPNELKTKDSLSGIDVLKKMGESKWKVIAKQGKMQKLIKTRHNTGIDEKTKKSTKGINNTDVFTPANFNKLAKVKKNRVIKNFNEIPEGKKYPQVELSLVARWTDGYSVLIGGNTRLTGMMNQFGEAYIWEFEVSDKIAKVDKKGKLAPDYSDVFKLPNPVPEKVEATKGEKTVMHELSSAEILRNVFANDASYATIEGVINDVKLLKKFNGYFKKGGKPVYHFDKENLLVEHTFPKNKQSIEYEWISSFYAQQEVMLTKFDKKEWTIYNRDKEDGGFMDYITNIIKTSFKEKVSKKDAWNPADIWLVRNQPAIVKEIDKRAKGDKKLGPSSIQSLNKYLTELYLNGRKEGTKGDALTGISLKKISGEQAKYEEVNLDPDYFKKIINKHGEFLYKLSKIKLDLSIQPTAAGFHAFKTQDTQLFLKDNTKFAKDRYSFQIKANTTKKHANLKFEGTDLQNRAALLGKAPLDLMTKVAEQHQQTRMFNETSRDFKQYLLNQSQPTGTGAKTIPFPGKTEKDGQGKTFADYKTMFTEVKDWGVDVGDVSTPKQFEDNFKKVFANTNQKEQHFANNKLQQLTWVWKLLNVFGKSKSNVKRNKYLTDMLYIAQKKGHQIFKFGPFGKLY